MKNLTLAEKAALESRMVAPREFIWIVARDRSDDSEYAEGYWSDLTTVSAQVRDPLTGSVVSRTFRGAGGLISTSPTPLVSDMSVAEMTVAMSQIGDANNLVRGYDLKQARVEKFVGLFTPSLVQIGPATPLFVGFVDDLEILTPEEDGDGGITLTCVGHSQEMSRINPATKSDAYMRARNPTDTLRLNSAVAGTWELNWSS